MVSLFTAVFAALALVGSSGSATPLARDTCAPNAQGAGVSIVSVQNSKREWGDHNAPPFYGDVLVSSSSRGLTVPDFHVQQSGQFPTSYVIKDVNNNFLAVTSQGSQLIFDAASNSGNQANQLFDINCQSCAWDTTPGKAAGSSCTVSPHGATGQCVAIGYNSADPLSVVGCSGSNSQLFNIVF
ncbi:hypothetical protein D9757_006540 [Collybiopsis confluens]|uniref:Uncharacterized protein n=1 Tax=Collybiopsis confluens TaxID=2823264 RepID=A0A8H5HQ25_9AGAR|nr:hypothetical protein D9757_006540 [Collybiopsis confluens]